MPVLAVLALLGAGCGTNGSAAGGFADNAGVLGCASSVAWGAVARSEPVSGRLRVVVDVEQWLHPEEGAETLTFLADDPAVEVAAPAWPPSTSRVLVVVSDRDPPQRLEGAEAERAVQQWRGAGSPRLPDEQCDLA